MKNSLHRLSFFSRSNIYGAEVLLLNRDFSVSRYRPALVESAYILVLYSLRTSDHASLASNSALAPFMSILSVFLAFCRLVPCLASLFISRLSYACCASCRWWVVLSGASLSRQSYFWWYAFRWNCAAISLSISQLIYVFSQPRYASVQ